MRHFLGAASVQCCCCAMVSFLCPLNRYISPFMGHFYFIFTMASGQFLCFTMITDVAISAGRYRAFTFIIFLPFPIFIVLAITERKWNWISKLTGSVIKEL